MPQRGTSGAPPAASPRTGVDPGGLACRRALIVIAALLLAAQIGAVVWLRDQLWGLHLLAFLPPWAAVASWAALAAAAGALLLRRPPGRAPRGEQHRPRAGVLRQLATPALMLVAGLGFWFLRSRQDLLGDAWPLINSLAEGTDFHIRQPLTAILQQQLYQLLGPLFRGAGRTDVEVARHTVACGSVLAGVLWVPVALALGRAVSRARRAVDAPTAWLAAGVLLTQGYCQLFFGYLENYTFVTVAIALFLLVSLLHLERRLPLIAPLVVLVLAVGLHLAAIVLAPALLVPIVRDLRDPVRRVPALRDLLLGVVAVVALSAGLGLVRPGFTLWGGLAAMAEQAGTGTGDSGLVARFSVVHWRDVLNTQLLIGPLGFLLVVAALIDGAAGAVRRGRDLLGGSAGRAATLFLALAALAVLGASWLAAEPALGYARDWDLFAPFGVVLAAAGTHWLVMRSGDARWRHRLLAFVVLASGMHLATWVAVNHSEARTRARFETLPLGKGRTEATLGSWYLRRGEVETAVTWLERAIAVEPANVNAHAMLGRIHLDAGQLEAAIDAFRAALAVRPDKTEYAMALGEALHAAGHGDEARHVYRRALELVRRDLAQAPDDFQRNLDAGVLLARLGDRQEAIPYFERAVTARPRSANALFNLCLMFVATDQAPAARPLFERFLELHPDHALAGRVRGWLDALGAREAPGALSAPAP
jgi:tetratricopeptide (TPR) repeat protein